MKIGILREFRDHTTRLMQTDEPLLVWSVTTLPLDLKRSLFLALTKDLAKHAAKAELDEAEVQEDFAAWRKKRRAAIRTR